MIKPEGFSSLLEGREALFKILGEYKLKIRKKYN
jgi:hypothetical protein